MPKQKHKMIMVVYEDGSTKFDFEGIENWAPGKLERQVHRGLRQLKTLQRQMIHKVKLAAHKKERAEQKAADELAKKAADALAYAKERSEYLHLKVVNGDVTEDDTLELATLLKEYPTLNTNEEVINHDNGNTRTESNTGSTGEVGNISGSAGDPGQSEQDAGEHADGDSKIPSGNAAGNDISDVKPSGANERKPRFKVHGVNN